MYSSISQPFETVVVGHKPVNTLPTPWLRMIGAWRTPESTLHWLAIAGGWPGALIAQQALRHKSRKQSFRAAFWFTVIINCGILAWMYTPGGIESVQAFLAQLGMHFNFGQPATIEWSN